MSEQAMNNHPLAPLHRLLIQVALELMEAAERANRASIEIKAMRKQVAIILAAIDANKQKETKIIEAKHG